MYFCVVKRKDFLKRGFLAGIGATLFPSVVNSTNVRFSEMNQVGFNHLPNKEENTMNTVLHKAETRGHANHGWLNSHHSFSFANYHNPERMNFGVIRVLNDDEVDPGQGFGTHPHNNMEIISIPLEGNLEHKDSMGNTTVIKSGDVQVMSAGTGVQHSEYNQSKSEKVKFLQIWLFPNKKNVEPRYDQISLSKIKKDNQLYQILSPNKNDEGVWIHQNAWFYLGEFDSTTNLSYTLNAKENGVYVFVLQGKVIIDNQELNKRDGFGLWNMNEIKINAEKGAKLLLMEVPMNI